MSKNIAKNIKNKWFDDDYEGYGSNFQQIKRKPKNNVDVKKEKNKTISRHRQPAFEDVVMKYKDADWY